MTYVILFVLGTISGSFLNVLALRWNSGLGVKGRSFCPQCFKKLRWYELVPVLSFIFLRRRCIGCKTRISWQYPIIEISTGLLFASLFALVRPDSLLSTISYLLLITVFSIYIIIVIYDLRHKIIPNELVYSAIGLSFLFALLNFQTYQPLDFLAGPIVFLFFWVIWALSKGRALGFGDAKLGASIGLILGAANGFSAVVLAFWIGAIITLSYMFLKKITLLKGGKRLTMKSEVPFAPFLVLGAWISIIFNFNLLHVVQF